MSNTLKREKFGSARTQVGIKEVRDGILILPYNRYRALLSTSSVNFELQSEDEQDVIIDTFQTFLNSLNSPIQILIRVRELDIDRYIEDFEQKCSGEKEKIYLAQSRSYCEFIKKLVAGNKILSRRFFLIIPYESKTPIDFEVVREQLNLEKEIVIKGLEKLSMTARPLDTLEVLDLFYSFYRPDQAKTQPLAKQIIRSSNEQEYF
ncbi:hypothetical protein A2215_03905 [Candidatus Berkelbacteria bacterium RIFOXYA2_FULL_43_10]|uniref:Uncharacterized protein n=1 Tax=Candidatus Berkelbacteria bacterium RIFOXYA2_FULL_43_10 TaxID=1797472 RepID=A0A1F5E451_9BACT|nr:MAG: hypothetical protein A2215_03905 [Candidatus Berkelbacteria bacterium RIFOXYA2_FULL_43_10]